MGDTPATQSELVRQFEESFRGPVSLKPEDFEPGTLFHYTGALAVEKILTEGKLRATNFSFMNDPTELEYGRKKVVDLLATEKRERGDTLLLEAVRESFEDVTAAEVYLCCFTQRRDDLGQWRGYGSSTAARYCIGFDLDALYATVESLSTESWIQEAVFEKVIYEEQEQRRLIQEVVDKATEFDSADTTDSETRHIAEAAARRLAFLLPRLKSNAYQSEYEWRIILWVPPTDISRIDFETSGGVLRPDVPVCLSHEKRHPVVDLVVLAPGREKQSLKAVEMLLRKVEISEVEPVHSTVPFADWRT